MGVIVFQALFCYNKQNNEEEEQCLWKSGFYVIFLLW